MATEADDTQLKQKVIAKADENMPTKADDTNMHQRQDQIYRDQAKKKQQPYLRAQEGLYTN